MDKKFIGWSTIVQHLLGKSTKEEARLVDEWLREDVRNQEYYKKARHYFDAYYSGKQEIPEVDMESAWDDFQLHVQKMKRNYFWQRFLRYAAVVIVFVGVGIVSLMLVNDMENPSVVAENQKIAPGVVKALLVFQSGTHVDLTDSIALEQVLEQFSDIVEADEDAKVEYNTIIVPRGGEYCLVLSDGTRIKMNSDSKLIFPNKFTGNERRVRLEGEALFDVIKNKDCPFIVETEKGNIYVLGTLFNVNVYSDEEVMQTTLVEGRIAFKGNGMSQSVNLVPGEQVVYNEKSGESQVIKVNPEIYVGWAEGKWYIEGERLEDIMKQVARWYDVEVFYKNSEAKELVFTGDLEKYKDCEEVLDIISMTTNVTFEIKDRVIVVEMKY